MKKTKRDKGEKDKEKPETTAETEVKEAKDKKQDKEETKEINDEKSVTNTNPPSTTKHESNENKTNDGINVHQNVNGGTLEQVPSTPVGQIPPSLTPSGEHPLETPWTFYYDRKLPKPTDFSDFEKNLHKLGTFRTLEGFWRHYSYLQSPEAMAKDHNLFLFRHSYVPAWESFPNGGCWIIKVRKTNRLVNRMWEELLCACVGELFGEPDLVGIELSTRAREDMLSVWNKDNTVNQVRFKIGEKLKEILNLDESTQVEYKPFSDSLLDGSTFRNAKPYVYAAQQTTSAAQALPPPSSTSVVPPPVAPVGSVTYLPRQSSASVQSTSQVAPSVTGVNNNNVQPFSANNV